MSVSNALPTCGPTSNDALGKEIALNKKGQQRLDELQKMVTSWIESSKNTEEFCTCNLLPLKEEETKLFIRDTVNFTPSAHNTKKAMGIKIDVLFLIKPEDLPKSLKLQGKRDPLGRDDPRFHQPAYLENTRKWIQNLFGLETVHIEPGILQMFMPMLSKPDMFEKAKQFVLAHELGHVIHRDIHPKVEGQAALTIAKISALVGGGVGAVFGALSLGSDSLFSVGCRSLGVTYGTFKICAKILSIWRLHTCERKADFFAKKLVGGEGGAFYFQTEREWYYSYRNQPNLSIIDGIWRRMIIDSDGNWRKVMFSHPLFSTREKYLSA